MYGSGFESFYSQNLRTGVKGEAGRGVVRMAEELRQAASLTNAQSSSLTFTYDLDDDGDDDTIQYTWPGTVGTALQRIGDVTTNLVNSVNDLTFSYYDSSNNLLSSPVTVSNVRIIAMDLTVSNQDEAFHLRSQVRLRNL